MSSAPLSQIHLVPFTKNVGCAVHPARTICSSFALWALQEFGALTEVQMGRGVLLSQLTPLFQLRPQSSFHTRWALIFHAVIKTELLGAMACIIPPHPCREPDRGQSRCVGELQCPPQRCVSGRGQWFPWPCSPVPPGTNLFSRAGTEAGTAATRSWSGAGTRGGLPAARGSCLPSCTDAHAAARRQH